MIEAQVRNNFDKYLRNFDEDNFDKALRKSRRKAKDDESLDNSLVSPYLVSLGLGSEVERPLGAQLVSLCFGVCPGKLVNSLLRSRCLMVWDGCVVVGKLMVDVGCGGSWMDGVGGDGELLHASGMYGGFRGAVCVGSGVRSACGGGGVLEDDVVVQCGDVVVDGVGCWLMYIQRSYLFIDDEIAEMCTRGVRGRDDVDMDLWWWCSNVLFVEGGTCLCGLGFTSFLDLYIITKMLTRGVHGNELRWKFGLGFADWYHLDGGSLEVPESHLRVERGLKLRLWQRILYSGKGFLVDVIQNVILSIIKSYPERFYKA